MEISVLIVRLILILIVIVALTVVYGMYARTGRVQAFLRRIHLKPRSVREILTEDVEGDTYTLGTISRAGTRRDLVLGVASILAILAWVILALTMPFPVMCVLVGVGMAGHLAIFLLARRYGE